MKDEKMKKKHTHDEATGVNGEQLSFLPPPPFSPTWPTRGTLADKALGMLSYPYWFFFERLAPVIEVVGLFYFGILILLNLVRWDYSIAFITLAYLFTVFFSLIALVTEELTYHQYKKKGTGFRLLRIAFLEPIVTHPFILYAAIRGNIDYYFNKNKKWGEMTRKGMTKG